MCLSKTIASELRWCTHSKQSAWLSPTVSQPSADFPVPWSMCETPGLLSANGKGTLLTLLIRTQAILAFLLWRGMRTPWSRWAWNLISSRLRNKNSVGPSAMDWVFCEPLSAIQTFLYNFTDKYNITFDHWMAAECWCSVQSQISNASASFPLWPCTWLYILPFIGNWLQDLWGYLCAVQFWFTCLFFIPNKFSAPALRQVLTLWRSLAHVRF